MKVSTSGWVISLSVLGLVISCSVLREPGVRQPGARADGFITLNVDGDDVRIYRDEFGVPHIFATTNRGLFAGYGYAIAQDRLWQLEVFRHAAQGRLAELLGATTVPTNPQIGQSTALAADTDIRTRHYTGTELQEQLALLDAEEREIFDAYAEGINRYLTTPWLLTLRASCLSNSTQSESACRCAGRLSMWWRTSFTSRVSARPVAKNGRIRLS